MAQNEIGTVSIPSELTAEELKEKALDILHKYYGYSDFRPGQWEVMEKLLKGEDAVVLMPTGGGKSLCFQIPALMAEGCCIVISPLIALMNDQVEGLRANGLPAAAVNSLNDERQNIDALNGATTGAVKLLYISPERLLMDLDRIRQYIKVSFVAVDEAHCISQWGHDFRPVYTDLYKIREAWAEIPIMALTATADRLTREDIGKALKLRDHFMHVGSFDRPNLSLTVIQGADRKERLRIIRSLLDKYSDACGIVYCLSRNKTEQMAQLLSEAGYRIGCYHAGMSAEDRHRVQKEFLSGRLQGVCATIAFGMGIDKSNIRWVVHNNIPGNIESYYQEIGRAGRDGLPAETILFYSFGDIITRRQFADDSGLPEVNEQKLEFMQRYAEAGICRRRILLSYFSEEMTHDCGNCDNCRQPRPRFDGTVLAQKALSAVIRTNSAEGMGTVIDILRGANNTSIRAKGYDRLPTYGVGRDVDTGSWHAYLLQMIQLGLLELAYEDNFHLRPTELGRKVVKGQERIELINHVAPVGMWFNNRPMRQPKPKDMRTPQEKAEESLRSLRRTMAEKHAISDDKVFSDVTLADLVRKMPKTPEELLKVEGINLRKFARLYKEILAEVREAAGMKRSIPKVSPQVTLILFRNGLNVDEIAAERNITSATIVNHLLELRSEGTVEVELERLVSPQDYRLAEPYLEELEAIPAESDPVKSQEMRDAIRKRFEEESGRPRDILYRVAAVRKIASLNDCDGYDMR